MGRWESRSWGNQPRLNLTLSHPVWAQGQALLGAGSPLCLLTDSAGGPGCGRGSGNDLIIRQEVLTSSFMGSIRRSVGRAPQLPEEKSRVLLVEGKQETSGERWLSVTTHSGCPYRNDKQVSRIPR